MRIEGPCRCGDTTWQDEGCLHQRLGYDYCHGCQDHHRTPVAATGEPCPVDVMMRAFELAGDGLVLEEHHTAAQPEP